MDVIRIMSAAHRQLAQGPRHVTSDAAIFGIEGPGAVTCLQGLLTNDVEKPGDAAFVYGALLTPKGMIAVDFHVLRQGQSFTLVADPGGHDRAVELFRRQLPPRLAKVTDRSSEWRALWMLGAGSDDVLASTTGVAASPGTSLTIEHGGAAVWIGRGSPAAAFRWLIVGPVAAVDGLAAAIAARGSHAAEWNDLRVARVLAGVPTLGAEIGEKTLPQEVRFDENEGVSYTKGCYVGQETVARIHFRGHPNRLLRGVELAGGVPPTDELELDGKVVGHITTAVDAGENAFGLAIVRREIEVGSDVKTATGPARVTELPFAR